MCSKTTGVLIRFSFPRNRWSEKLLRRDGDNDYDIIFSKFVAAAASRLYTHSDGTRIRRAVFSRPNR